jgi:signal transduction histidine kinase
MIGNWSTVQKLLRLLDAPSEDPVQRASRIQTVEADIVLPIKGLLIFILTYYFFYAEWFDRPDSPRDKALVIIRYGFYVYVAINVIAGMCFLWAKNMPAKWLEGLVFVVGVSDAVLMVGLTCLTDGSDSSLYWFFFAIILHNALAIPSVIPQLLLNLIISYSYYVGAYLDHAFLQSVGLDPTSRTEENRFQNPNDRLMVLLLWAACCYGIKVLFERQKKAEQEATEFAVRQERLHTAGRLAAEIAHKIKNPLGIITNAAFCLQHAVREGQTAVDEQISIIREEVERADRILTELMGYAQLAEGKVEKLEVVEAVNAAVDEVFPPAAKYEVAVRRDYDENLPALLMQRRHLSDVLVNLLQNAREAMNGVGQIDVSAKFGRGDSVIITITDNGPGIPQDRIEKIFDAYFTTRAKGTGLGLAIVKHNTEMYGGTVRVQSELGKGTTFILEFPPRILMKLTT